MPFLLIHGLGQTPEAWEETRRLLPFSDVHCPDLIHLLDGAPAEYSTLYQAFTAYCDALPQPLHLCGLSLGGVLALQYAAEHPARVASLVLIGTPYRIPHRMLALQSAIFRLLPKCAFRQMGFSKADVLRLSGSMAALDPAGFLPAVSCPTLILCGGKDHTNRAAAQEIAAALPRACLQIIPGAGHEANRDAPAQLALALARFRNTHS